MKTGAGWGWRWLPLLLLLAASGQADPDRPQPLLRLVTHEFPPFAMLVDGQVTGPARQLIDRVCRAIEYRCEHQLLPWARAQARVRSGEADGMYVIGWNSERTQWLHFSTPLLRTEYGVFVPDTDLRRFVGGASIEGLRVGVYGPSNTSRSLQQLAQSSGARFTPVEENDSARLLRMLQAGRLDAVYGNRDVGFALIRDLKLRGIRYAGRHRPLEYFLGLSRQTTTDDLNLRFTEAYQQLQQQGVVGDILLSYGLTP